MGPKITGDGNVPLTKGESLPMVHVVAPATLTEGYTFEAQSGDRTFTVTVPQGGVEEGQTFLAPIPYPDNDGPRMSIPIGHWKDGTFDCFNNGYFHPSVCCSIWFSQLALGQVMQRMKLTWLGQSGGPEEQTRNTFNVVCVLYLAYLVYSVSLDYLSPDYVYENIQEVPVYIKFARTVGNIFMFSYSVYALKKTRESIRIRYSIPEERCHGSEDLLCACCCYCCTVSQLARHTGEYETYKGMCCTKTGLPIHAPAIV